MAKAKAKKVPVAKKAPVAKKPPSLRTIAHVTESTRSSLGVGEEGVETVEDGRGGCEVSYRGTPYASFSIDGDRIWVAVLVPRGQGLTPKVAWEPERKGWVKLALPLARDPRPWLQSGIGGLLIETKWELRNPGHQHRALSSDGPYVVVPSLLVGLWNPKPKKLAVANDVTVLEDTHSHDHILLANAGPLSWHPLPGGGVLARVTRGAIEPSKIDQHVGAVAGWAPAGQLRVRAAQMWAFAAARPGEAFATRKAPRVTRNDALMLGVVPGNYQLATAVVAPADETELLLVRLRA